MNSFAFTYPTRVYFGTDATDKYLVSELKKYGKNVLLAYGKNSIKRTGVYDEMMNALKEAEKNVYEFSGIMPNPTYAKVQEGARICKDNDIDFILAVGGGSVSDCCKIVSAQAKTDDDIWTMEFSNHRYPEEFIPMGVVVTMSGTGSEMNNGAVITNEELKLKSGIIGAYADFAILNPTYTLTVPLRQAVSGAFDTLSHCMETYFGKPSESFITDEINEAVMRNTIANTRKMVVDPTDVYVRGELLWDSAMGENGILKIGKVTDFQCHQIEHQLGAFTDCNHGMGLAAVHPTLYRHLYKDNLEKFVRFAREVWNVNTEGKTDEEIALEGISCLEDFEKEIGMPTSLSEMNITDKEILRKTADTCNITRGCARQLSRDKIYDILLECL